MKKNLTLLFALVLAVGIVAILVVSKEKSKFSKSPSGMQTSSSPVEANPAPTGKPDDVAQAILQGANEEDAALSAEDQDVSLVGNDNAEINNLGQAYDKNAF